MRNFIVVCIGFLLIGCASNNAVVINTKDGNSVNDLIENKSFEITSKWAAPRSVNIGFLLPVGTSPNNIPITGTKNHFIQKGDSIDISLPYYGELQMGKGFVSRDAGIQFSGTPEEYTSTYDEGKKFHKVDFKIKDGQESYTITLRLYNNLTSRIHVFSSHRSSIIYTGVVKEISD